MRLGILGGTFDPIHLGHLLIAEITRETLRLERILFVPAGNPPHKQTVVKTLAHHRRRMVELAIEDNPCFELCDIDLKRPGPHYSVDTVSLIRAGYALSAEECFFIIGGDSLADLPTWYNPGRLITLCRLAVAHRPGYRPDIGTLEQVIPGLTHRLDWVPMGAALDLASSAIRTRAATGQSIRYQVSDRVERYIKAYKIYQ